MEMTQIAQALTTVYHPHPITPLAGREVKPHLWQSGETVREVLLRHGFDPHHEIVVILNDRLLLVEEWDTVCPQPKDIINVQAVASGGGGKGGSDPVRVILTIVVMVVAWYYAPELAAYMGGSAGAYTAGFMLAGNLLINALLPPTSLDLKNASGQGDTSPTYSLAGGSNRLRPYEPLPVVMGAHRLFPDAGSKPYTEFRGEDQYLYQIFNFGLSALSFSDFRIGETSISNYDDVQFCWPDANGTLPGFPSNVDSASGGQLIRGADWTVRTSSDNATALAVDLEGTCYWADKTGGLRQTMAVINAEYAVAGTGNWLPFASGPVTTYGKYYWSRGYWFANRWNQVAYGSTTLADHTDGDSAGAWPESSTSATGFVWSFQAGIPANVEDGSSTEPTATFWRWRPYAEILTNGDGSPLKEPAPPQPTSTVMTSEIDIQHGASQKPQRRSIRIDVPKGKYDVRVRLTSARAVPVARDPNPIGAEIPDNTTEGGYVYSFHALRTFQEDTASYAGQTRLGLIIRATGQLNGVVQQLSALATAYCAYWDGSAWVWGPTSNPAWWFLDFARGRYIYDARRGGYVLAYGCGLPLDQVDLDAIKAWAAFCDAQGLACNLVLDRAQPAADVLNTIARLGMGSPSWASGKLGAVWDSPNLSPVAAFGMSNICKGSFSVEYVTESLADEITVNYIDPDQDWSQQQIRVLVPGTTVPARPTTVDLMGCTSAAMAGKYANALAAQQVYRRRTITWETDFEGFVCQRGDVVMLSHDLTQWGYSGRVVSVAGNVLTLDRAVPRSGAVDYVMLRTPDGNLTTYTATTGAGGPAFQYDAVQNDAFQSNALSDTLTLTTAPVLQDGYGPVDHVWFCSPLPTPGKKVKIISVQPVSESRVRLVATDEDPAYYTAWNGTFTQVQSQSLLKDGTPQIDSLDATETLVLSGGIVLARVNVSWRVSGDYDHAILRWRLVDQTDWSNYIEVSGTQYDIDISYAGKLEVEITPVSSAFAGAKITNRWAIYCRSLPPGDVTGLALAVSGGVGLLTFDPAPDLDVQYGGRLWLRYTSALTGVKWENAIDVAVTVPGNASSTTILPQSGTYLAKWIDSDGNVSVNAALLTTDYAAIADLNAVASLSGDPAWSGAKTGLAYDATQGGIVLDSAWLIDSIPDAVDSWSSFSYYNGVAGAGAYSLGTIDVGQVYDCTLSLPALVVETWDCITDFDARTEVMDTWPWFNGAGADDGNAAIYVRLTNNDPNAGSPVWTDWQLMMAGGTYRARGFQFELRLYSSRSTVNITAKQCTVRVDAPDRAESGQNIASGTGTYHVAFAQAFVGQVNVGITAQNMATGDYYTLTNKTLSGFDIAFKNAAGTGVSRTFDWVAKGY